MMYVAVLLIGCLLCLLIARLDVSMDNAARNRARRNAEERHRALILKIEKAKPRKVEE